MPGVHAVTTSAANGRFPNGFPLAGCRYGSDRGRGTSCILPSWGWRGGCSTEGARTVRLLYRRDEGGGCRGRGYVFEWRPAVHAESSRDRVFLTTTPTRGSVGTQLVIPHHGDVVREAWPTSTEGISAVFTEANPRRVFSPTPLAAHEPGAVTGDVRHAPGPCPSPAGKRFTYLEDELDSNQMREPEAEETVGSLLPSAISKTPQ